MVTSADYGGINMTDNDLEDRIVRIEDELDDIRSALKTNTSNISKLYSAVSKLDGKFNTLIGQMQSLTDILNTVFSQYKSLMNTMIINNTQRQDYQVKHKTIKEIAQIIAYSTVSIVAISFGVKMFMGI